jgi:hypothetical protein
MFSHLIREVAERQEPNLSMVGQPSAEAQALAQIEKLCRVAGMSAQIIVAGKRNPAGATEFDRCEQQRYERLRLQAVRLADKLTDDFYRASAIHSLIELCMTAEDIELARVWLKHVRVDKIREKIIAAYPQLARLAIKEELELSAVA